VLFYDLLVKVDPQQQFISGNNRIRFRVIHDFDRMQIDLFASMAIEKIVFQGKELAYTREFNAVFVRFPSIQAKGAEEEIDIFYSGRPQIPDASSLAGGFFWMQDKQGHFWIESVSQGSGASLWWPCKDHLSDKPDSMQISVIVPRGLMDISNGRLRRTTELPANLTRFDWFVSYPINNYCVAVNIGNYAHFSDLFINGPDTMDLNFYCMPYHLAIARQIFRHVQPMLRLYEADFGPYPFARDGFSIMESIYPMEHQSAVSIGSINNPFNSDKFDSLDLIRASWHESAHEWWGNSVSCQDMADLWIHEAFATYAEVLAYETFDGKLAALKYLHSDPPGNQQAIIGTYGVNDFHLGDMYSKGALLLHTLRNLIDNDSVWFSLLRGIQTHFAYQTVRTEDIEQYFSTATKTDYSYIFDQYLRHPAIPVLHVRMSPKGSTLHLEYKWSADVPNFRMPVKITISKSQLSFIYPNGEWQSTVLNNMKPSDFRVDTDSFYVNVVIE
jgi:aminopeptidase N